MSADFPRAWDVDLSHLQRCSSISIFPVEVIATKSSHRFLLIAFLGSVFLHSLLLATNWQIAPELDKPRDRHLSIRLNPAPLAPLDVAPLDVTPLAPEVNPSPEPVLDNPMPDLPQPAPIEPVQREVQQVQPRIIQSLTSEELRELRNIPSVEPAPTRGIAANVFNPKLRQRLQEEERKPDLQRADVGPKTYTDPSGATIVDLGGGKCLRASAPKPGEEQNWYMTACGGKSESDQMIDRINQSVNGKLTFGE